MPKGKIRIPDAGRKNGYLDDAEGNTLEFRFQDSPGLNVASLASGTPVEFERGKLGNKVVAVQIKVIATGNIQPSAAAQTQAPPDRTRRETTRENSQNALARTENMDREAPARGSVVSDNFLNPYNFVRTPGPIVEKNILGRMPPPSHDRWVGLSGRITCTLDVKTPLFISDAQEVDGKEGEHRKFRFFRWNDQPTVPASSLRGMVRSVFEAATNSCFSIFQSDDPYPLEYRKTEVGRWIPARVVEVNGHGVKLELLDASDTNNPAYPVGVELHRNTRHGRPLAFIRTGVIHAYAPRVLNQSQVAFRPGPPFYRMQNGQAEPVFQDGTRIAARVKLALANHRDRYQYFEVNELVPADQHMALRAQTGEQIVYGYVHVTGPNIENKHDERIFFRWNDPATKEAPSWNQVPKEVRLEGDEMVVKEYNAHLKEYYERNEKQVKELNRRFADKAWQPENDTVPFPSTFIQVAKRLQAGDLVYAIVENNRVDSLRPVAIPRVRYAHKRQDYLRTHAHCKDYDALCPACRVFGWVTEKAKPDQARISYAGRVRFSHAIFTTNDLGGEEKRLAILSSPKPTTWLFYLAQQNGKPATEQRGYRTDYNDDAAQLRGRKVYRKHEGDIWKEANPHEMPATDQNRTLKEYIERGATTTFSVDFENLAGEELGALLWALEINGWEHRLGFAKPLGLGSVRVCVSKLELKEFEGRYAGWDKPAFVDQTDLKSTLTSLFKSSLARVYAQTNFDALLNVQDLKALLGESPVLEIHYPRLKSNAPQDAKNFEWFMRNMRGDGRNLDGRKEPLGLAATDTGLPSEPTKPKTKK